MNYLNFFKLFIVTLRQWFVNDFGISDYFSNFFCLHRLYFRQIRVWKIVWQWNFKENCMTVKFHVYFISLHCLFGFWVLAGLCHHRQALGTDLCHNKIAQCLVHMPHKALQDTCHIPILQVTQHIHRCSKVRKSVVYLKRLPVISSKFISFFYNF